MTPTNKHRNFNTQTPDIKSAITAFGKHNRVITCFPSYDPEYGCTIIYARVDHVNNLPNPTINQILAIARAKQNTKGAFTLIDQSSDDNGLSTHYYFKQH
jgi:hypothetical protein